MVFFPQSIDFMAARSMLPLILLSISLQSVFGSIRASYLCHPSEPAFLDVLRLQCPLLIEPSPPLKVSGQELDRELNNAQRSTYYSVLFYASWCPFSRRIEPIFETLSSMYPQIRHLAVEESSVMPSVFSRYGVHSFPSIIISNRAIRARYRGPKDLSSLVDFYREVTGMEPVAYIVVDEPNSSGNLGTTRLWDQSPREILSKEPYLAFGLFFICLKILMYLFPKIFSHLKAFWAMYAWNLNLGILGESNQLLERVLHVIDIKRLWSKIRLCNKARNFREGARNARVWASSLASVSLGDSSSSSGGPSNS